MTMPSMDEMKQRLRKAVSAEKELRAKVTATKLTLGEVESESESPLALTRLAPPNRDG